MKTQDHSEALEMPDVFGVFKPVDHIVAAFKTQAAALSAQAALISSALLDKRVAVHTSDEMLDLAEHSLRNAGVMAAFGFELELARLHLSLAQAGCSFLMVHTEDDEETSMVAELLRSGAAVAAHRYGTFVVEELIGIDPNVGLRQHQAQEQTTPSYADTPQGQQPDLAQAQMDFTAEGAPPSAQQVRPLTSGL